MQARECLHHHSRRTRIHVRVDALAGAGAVLLLVRAVRDLRLHHARGGEAALRRHALPGSPAYEAGANWVGVLFATYNGLGALAALIIPWFVRRYRHAPHAPDQPVAGRGRAVVDAADPRSRLAAGVDDRTRLRVGLHHFPALRHAGQQPAVAEDGREHRHLQHLHRDPAAAGGRPCWAGCSTCSPTAILPSRSSSAPSAGSWRGWRCSASARPPASQLHSARKRTARPPPGASAASRRSVEVTRRFSMTSAAGLLR